MTGVGLLGVLLGLAAFPFASAQRTRTHILIFFALLTTHVAASVGYYLYALNTSADSILYYEGTDQLLKSAVASGTIFTIQLVDALKSLMGGSYLDYFLLFQAIGFWGIVLLMRVFDELRLEVGVALGWLPWAILFLPSMHFWTAAIGKDAPLFFATSLAVWSALRLGPRLHFMALAICLMVLFRPHVALVAAISLALAAGFGRGRNPAAKAGLFVLAAVGVALTASSVENALEVDLSNPAAIGAFVERQQAQTQEIGGTTSVHGANFFVRMLSLLFRPFFVDATGLMGLIASFENVLALGLVGYLIKYRRESMRMLRVAFFARFALIFTLILILLLSFLYYNVGLGLRQRVMLYPAIFSFFVAQWLVHSAALRNRRPEATQPASSGAPMSL